MAKLSKFLWEYLLHKGFTHVVNLEMDNSLKWVPFKTVSGQITSTTL